MTDHPPVLPGTSTSSRFIVTVTRVNGDTEDIVVLGPFRRIERARARAATVARLMEKYDDPEAAFFVHVDPLRSGDTSAQTALDYLYGAIE